ncbi:MAG: HIT domain-containing protein [Usitatibacter sp.]
MTLLQNRGSASTTDIAKAILSKDQSQIEYYEEITRDMVGKVLRNHHIVERDGKDFRLAGFEALDAAQIEELIALCQTKLDEYLEARGQQVWQHRRQSAGYISGTLRYEILRRSAFHCELCGVSANVRALEVDHIVPRNLGGSDEESNLQALCYSCNAMKRDRDDSDLRKVRESYSHREAACLFCEIFQEPLVLQNELAYVVYDAYPVTKYHSLVIPKRHVPDYFHLSRPELNACDDLIRQMREKISGLDGSVTGCNIGMNEGEDAGQTIFHCHIHLIPRRKGDVASPRGGVRHLIPGKGTY